MLFILVATANRRKLKNKFQNLIFGWSATILNIILSSFSSPRSRRSHVIEKKTEVIFYRRTHNQNYRSNNNSYVQLRIPGDKSELEAS